MAIQAQYHIGKFHHPELHAHGTYKEGNTAVQLAVEWTNTIQGQQTLAIEVGDLYGLDTKNNRRVNKQTILGVQHRVG